MCLRGCGFILAGIAHVVYHCQELVELNISCLYDEYLCQQCVNSICDNLSTKIEKLDVTRQKNFGDEQLKKLLNRCDKLSEFAFGFTSVTDASVDTIIEKLSDTLIKIDPNDFISLKGLLRLNKSLPKLKVFRLGWLSLSNEEKEEAQLILPHLIGLNEELEIATPYPFDVGQKGYEPSGFWELKGKPKPIFEEVW